MKNMTFKNDYKMDKDTNCITIRSMIPYNLKIKDFNNSKIFSVYFLCRTIENDNLLFLVRNYIAGKDEKIDLSLIPFYKDFEINSDSWNDLFKNPILKMQDDFLLDSIPVCILNQTANLEFKVNDNGIITDAIDNYRKQIVKISMSIQQIMLLQYINDYIMNDISDPYNIDMDKFNKIEEASYAAMNINDDADYIALPAKEDNVSIVALAPEYTASKKLFGKVKYEGKPKLCAVIRTKDKDDNEYTLILDLLFDKYFDMSKFKSDTMLTIATMYGSEENTYTESFSVIVSLNKESNFIIRCSDETGPDKLFLLPEKLVKDIIKKVNEYN